MVVLSVLLFAVAAGAAVGVIAATVAPRWSLIVSLLRHGPAADWAPPPPRRGARRAAAIRTAVPATRSALAA